MPFAKTKSLPNLIAGSCMLIMAACSKHDNGPVTAPSEFEYTPTIGVSLKGTADTSVTPVISWNGKKGTFSFGAAVPQGVTINSSTGKISWPSSLAIGSYLVSVVAGNGAATSDTSQYTISISGPISTIAGTGTVGFAGDGGSALNAQFNTPSDLAVDANNNLYVADSYNHRVRIIHTDGTINTFAGIGIGNFSGDGGPAAKADISYPIGLVFDSTGSLFITDYGNNRIRKVNAAGAISTVAGSTYTTAYYLGDGLPATSAGLYLLAGKIALGPDGSMYIADYGNQRVRQVTPDGIMHTLIGTGSGGLSVPDGTAAASANLTLPTSVYFDHSKNQLYVVSLNDIIYRLNGGNMYKLAGGDRGIDQLSGHGEQANAAGLNRLSNLVVDKAGNIFFTEFGGNKIQRISPDGILSTIAGTGKYGFSGDGGPATAAKLARPYGLTVDSNGDLYFTDTDNNRIRKVVLH